MWKIYEICEKFGAENSGSFNPEKYKLLNFSNSPDLKSGIYITMISSLM